MANGGAKGNVYVERWHGRKIEILYIIHERRSFYGIGN
jgi:hypothetical protein